MLRKSKNEILRPLRFDATAARSKVPKLRPPAVKNRRITPPPHLSSETPSSLYTYLFRFFSLFGKFHSLGVVIESHLTPYPTNEK